MVITRKIYVDNSEISFFLFIDFLSLDKVSLFMFKGIIITIYDNFIMYMK